MKKPIEAAPIFYNRPRLGHIVPLFELVKLVKINSCEYSEIRRCTELIINITHKLFYKDILSLSLFESDLIKGVYRITSQGINKVKDRLSNIYSDGKDFSYASSELINANIEPLVELKPEIVKTEKEALLAASTSEKIAEEIGLKVSYYPIVPLSPYQLSSSLSSEE